MDKSPRDAIAQALGWLHRGDQPRALRELEQLVEQMPVSALAHNALGSVRGAVNQPEPAIEAFRRALELQPKYPEASTNLGKALLDTGRVNQACVEFERALTLAGVPVQAELGLGHALCLLGRHPEAGRCFERASRHPQAQAATHSQRCYASLLDPTLSAQQIVAIHRDYQTQVAARLCPQSREFRNERSGNRRLVLGCVSADFREHSVASFLLGWLAAHDRSRFRLIAYSDAPREDATTTQIRGLVDAFHRVCQSSDAHLAEQVKADRVDMLVDLAGHMQPNRLSVFARRPAPVLLTYLGYPGTTGMSVFDGRLTDDTADPTDDPDRIGPEHPVRVVGGLFCYTPPSDAPEVNELPALSGQPVTLGCMNDVMKVNDRVLEVWGRILALIPQAHLLLKSRSLASTDIRERFTRVLCAHGATPDRVELLPSTPTRHAHLQTYGRVDIALDTFPYAGATTTAEALYMGVPVLTLAGIHHAGRLGVSLLSAVGLGDWVASSEEEYVAMAVTRARDLGALSRLRSSLRKCVCDSTLSDGRRVARAIEDFARDRFERWSRQLP
jgi:predicted O-linked N-acetylglucosamine transferase (SPINDLY family)